MCEDKRLYYGPTLDKLSQSFVLLAIVHLSLVRFKKLPSQDVLPTFSVCGELQEGDGSAPVGLNEGTQNTSQEAQVLRCSLTHLHSNIIIAACVCVCGGEGAGATYVPAS